MVAILIASLWRIKAFALKCSLRKMCRGDRVVVNGDRKIDD